mmetsp:Transcript_70856/g.224309  ORF Transcript_70856/g.224309 Transcript_70856/m.224309 type:complete len:296 (-) Transcript_70856:1449-2336(-)
MRHCSSTPIFFSIRRTSTARSTPDFPGISSSVAITCGSSSGPREDRSCRASSADAAVFTFGIPATLTWRLERRVMILESSTIRIRISDRGMDEIFVSDWPGFPGSPSLLARSGDSTGHLSPARFPVACRTSGNKRAAAVDRGVAGLLPQKPALLISVTRRARCIRPNPCNADGSLRAIENQNVHPPNAFLGTTPAEPPSFSAFRSTDVSPSPVPPTVPLTCTNGRNRLAASRALIPFPVSSTEKTSSSVALACADEAASAGIAPTPSRRGGSPFRRIAAAILMCPRCVYLTALPT